MPHGITTIIMLYLTGVAIVAFRPFVVCVCQGLRTSTLNNTKRRNIAQRDQLSLLYAVLCRSIK